MGIVADFSVPTDAWCLGETQAALPTATVELDRFVAHNPEYVMPFLWVLDTTPDAFEEAVLTDPTVESATVTGSFDGAHLYQIGWTDVVSDRLRTIVDHDGVILNALGSGER
ncbi:hypothetical protein HALDL1_08365 [Halobacterium sp. DL1]|jgi:hypothetical protein|nr:hypothetical protein HALDL1_08365 [Halobacterium sp. DL1]